MTALTRFAAGFIVGILFAIVILASVAKAESFQIPPTTKSRMNDFANVLTKGQIREIEEKLYKIQTGYDHKPEFIVVTVPNLDGTSIENVAQDVFTKWKVGRKDLNNGIVLVLAKEGDRKIRIQTGYGFEPYITDLMTVDVIRSVQSNLATNDFHAAIVNVISNKDIHAGIVKFGEDNKIAPTVAKKSPESGFFFVAILFLGLMIFFFFKRKKVENYNSYKEIDRKSYSRNSYMTSRTSENPTFRNSYPTSPAREIPKSRSSYSSQRNNETTTRNDDSSFTAGAIAGMIAETIVSSALRGSDSDSDSGSSWSSSSSDSSYDSYSNGGGDSGGSGSSD